MHDPEIPVNIYDLGLIYSIRIRRRECHVDIDMSLTAPGCPVAGEMPGWVADAVEPSAGREDGRCATGLGAALGAGDALGRGAAGTWVYLAFINIYNVLVFHVKRRISCSAFLAKTL